MVEPLTRNYIGQGRRSWRSMQQDEPSHGASLSFQLAAEQVERRLGYSWGRAQKAILDACKRGEFPSRHRFGSGPDISEAHLRSWLDRPNKPRTGKRPRIIAYLAEMFPNQRVPEPAHYSRMTLKADLLNWDRSLSPLDVDTLKSAIDEWSIRTS